MLYIGASDAASLFSSKAQFGGVLLDLRLRPLGVAVFALLALRNRRQVGASPAAGGSVEFETA